jgi:hypothetical protein
MSTQPVPPQPDAAQPAQAKKASPLGCLVVLLLVLAVGGGGGYLLWAKDKDSLNRAKEGDCLRETRDDKESPFRIVACGDAKAEYKVLKLKPRSADCKDVAGAQRAAFNDDNNVCIGDKDADPAKAINVAKEGDCVSMSGGEAQRVDCSAPDAQYKVLKRLTDVLEINAKSACNGVAGAETAYQWNWQSDGQFSNLSRMNVDLILCLGKK